MARYKRLLRYAYRQWPRLALIVALTAATSVATAFQPWPLKLLLDYALSATAVPAAIRALLESYSVAPTPAVLIVLAAASSLAVFALNSILDVGLSWAWTTAGQRMVYDLAADVLDRLLRQSAVFHSKRAVGDSLSRLSSDTWAIYSAIDGRVVSPIQQVLILATIGAIAWRLDQQLAVMTLGVAPVLAVSSWVFGPGLKRRARLNSEAQSRLLSFVHQTLSTIPVVQAFGSEDRNVQRFRGLSSDAVALAQQSSVLKSTHAFANGLITTLGTAMILYTGSRRVLLGTLSLGTLLVFLTYIRALQSASQKLLGTYANLKAVDASFDRVFEILDAEEAVREAPDARSLPPRGVGEGCYIRLDHVTFGYERECPVVHDFTLQIDAGETIALVGPTGAGKTTLVSLIPRFFDPWSGRVCVDGLDVREVQLSSLRARVAVVLQEPFLLPVSVAENIGYGRLGATRTEIRSAATAAYAEEFISKLPDGYDTVLGDRGATLSIGQRQQLALARALLKDAPVIILDEPTSALDARTEALLLKAIERLIAGRTTLIVAHRLSTVRRANRILVLEHGRIMEAGTEPELLATDGIYRRFHQLQFGSRAPEVLT